MDSKMGSLVQYNLNSMPTMDNKDGHLFTDGYLFTTSNYPFRLSISAIITINIQFKIKIINKTIKEEL